LPALYQEEKHYYPYGLPIQGWGNVATGSLPNRQRYQGNEYREEAGLNWMDFHNRQYDPQLGRFLGVDALAGSGGQQVLSPYHAMACNPAMMVDPLGLRSDVFDNGARPIDNTPRVSPIIPVNSNARYIILDQMMYADHAAFLERIRREKEAEAEGESDEEPSDAAISFVALLTMYGNVNGEDASGHNFRTDDVSFDGKNRISIFSGNLTLNISTRDDGRIGIYAFGVYNGDLSKYSKTEWIQIAFTNKPLIGKPYEKWFKDYAKDDRANGRITNKPFYFDKGAATSAWRKDMASIHGGPIFLDSPNRGSGNYYWQGQLSLVGFRNGSWETIQTIRYGFKADGIDINYMSQFFLNLPDANRDNLYNTTINSLNNFIR